MMGSDPHRAGSHQPEPTRSQQQGNFPNPEHGQNEENGRFQEGSINTTQTNKSHSRVGSHISQRRDDKQAMQREINDLKRKLRLAQRRQSPLAQTHLSTTKTMTTIGKGPGPPPSETFFHVKEPHQRHERRSPSPKGLGHDAMNRALDQLSRSHFIRRTEGAALPWRFQQPTFTIYNGNTDPVEHVSQFNQRMAVHYKNEVLMCKFSHPAWNQWR